jgi:hypothetical protein
MFSYQPTVDSFDRTIWYGNESTQVHYEYIDNHGQWVDGNVRTLGGGIPAGVSELQAELIDYYNHCQ